MPFSLLSPSFRYFHVSSGCERRANLSIIWPDKHLRTKGLFLPPHPGASQAELVPELPGPSLHRHPAPPYLLNQDLQRKDQRIRNFIKQLS